jgi:hypothetical protein
MIQTALSSGLFHTKWIGADGSFGHDSFFSDSLPEGTYYFVNIRKTDTFFIDMPEV